MSTVTSGSEKIQANTHTKTLQRGPRLQNWLLILQVFVAGAASLSIEMAASRLLAPYFGSSLFVWASLIGLILLYLTLGYYGGGLLADRYPRPQLFYTITGIAALLIALIPFIAQPILHWSLFAFVSSDLDVFYGSLVSILALFALPMILLGCVSPFAIRLRMEQVGKSGRTAGMLYAIATAGSIAGTFVPVLVLMPYMGTALTFQVTAATLLLMSLIGLLCTHNVVDKPIASDPVHPN
jgi:predicted membrane-bound spermidine synthase